MAAIRPTAPAHVLVAEESYGRCGSEAFFQAFYRRFLASHPDIPPRFAATDFERQSKLLQHAMGLLMSYAKRPNPVLLARIAARHDTHDLNVPPALYAYFVDALIGTVREFDPRFSPELELAWREAVRPGIEFMQGRHGERTGPQRGND